MILITALMAAGAALALIAPAVLSRIDFSSAPGVGIAAWLGGMAATMGCDVLVLIALAWPGDPPGNLLAGSMVRSLATIEPTVVTWVAGLITPAVVVGTIVPSSRLARIAIGHHERGAAMRRRHEELIRMLGRADPAGDKLVRLDHPIPLAYSVSGRGGYIVVTEGLSDCLSEAQWHAVLAHERAHLRGFHHHILGVCQVLAKAFRWIPLFVAAPAAVTTLVELAADRSAASSTDPLTLSSALRAVAAHGPSASAVPLGLVDESLTTRLACLSVPPESRSASRIAATTKFLATMLLAPLAAVVAVAFSATVACLLTV